MNHPTPHASALLGAMLTLALLQAACSDGMQVHAATRVAPNAQPMAVGVYLPSQYPAPQGETEELPAQF